MAPIGKNRQSLGVPRMKPSGSNTTLQGEKPPTTLKLWIIRIQGGGVVVEGYKSVSENDSTTLQNWRSTPIATRIDAKTVQTHSGSVYKLKGGIDEDEAAEAGIPEKLINEFSDGFPENWEELIHEQLQEKERVRRRESMNTTTTVNTATDDDEEWTAEGNQNPVLHFDETMDTEETEDDDKLKEAKKRRSIQKGRKSTMQRVQPVTPIEEEDEEEEEEEKRTPARSKSSPARRGVKTPVTRNEDTKTPRGRGRGRGRESDMGSNLHNEEPARAAASAASAAARPSTTPKDTVNRRKSTPRGGKRMKKEEEEEEEEEVFATPDEIPRRRDTRTLSIVPVPQQRKEKTPSQRRVSYDDIPKEIMEKSVPLTRWVIRFVKGGSPTSIFPHFQFKCCGYRPECEDNEWNTSVIQKVVPPFLLFTSSSIYRLVDGMDVDLAAGMGFPPAFISDFLMGFPDDWEERLETFYNKTFGPPPQPRIVELMSDGGTVDDGRVDEGKRKRNSVTPRNRDGQKYRVNGLKFEFGNEKPASSRKRKEPTPSSSDSGEESESEGEEQLRREAMRIEKEERRKEERDRREAELKAKAKEEKKKRFEVKVNRTPEGVPVSRSGRTLRTPLATWAGENITYNVHGEVVQMSGVTTTTKLTVGKTKERERETEMLAAHYGIDSPLNEPAQKERAIAPPSASLPKTPAPKKSVADYRGFSDDDTDQIPYNEYILLKKAELSATPAYNLKKGKRRCRVVESSDSEAEEKERKKEEKRRKKEEKKRLLESEEEESSDDGMRRKKRSKSRKKTVVKKEKVKRAPSKKSRSKKEESSEGEEDEEDSDLDIEHDEDAVTFVPDEEGSNEGGNGYSDDEFLKRLEDERDGAYEKNDNKKEKKTRVKRAREWKKEELIRLKLAIQAADPSMSVDGWENVAKSLGGERTAEECRKIARERLKMKVEEPRENEYESESGAESGAASEDEEKKKRRNAKLDDDNQPKGITAKKGTIQYAVEMENKKREYITGGSASQEDYFRGQDLQESGAEALPSVAVFDPDDSLLSIFDDDDEPAPKQRTTKTAKAAAAAAPSTPIHSVFGGSFDSVTRSSRRSSAKFIDSPVVNQDDLTRYVHQISRSKNISMLSKSVADRSRMAPPKLPKGRQVARAAEEIDRAERKLKSRGRRANEMEDVDEDEENNEGNVLDGLL